MEKKKKGMIAAGVAAAIGVTSGITALVVKNKKSKSKKDTNNKKK